MEWVKEDEGSDKKKVSGERHKKSIIPWHFMSSTSTPTEKYKKIYKTYKSEKKMNFDVEAFFFFFFENLNFCYKIFVLLLF